MGSEYQRSLPIEVGNLLQLDHLEKISMTRGGTIRLTKTVQLG